MQDTYKHHVESVIRLRRQLAEVETRRAGYGQKVPPECWQEFLDASCQLEQAEKQVRQASLEVTAEINQLRVRIQSTLEEYNHWRWQVRQVESLFLANIIRPGHKLKEAIRQREHLQDEYQRIYTAIQQEKYASQQELESDLRQVLSRDELTPETISEEEELDDLYQENPFKRLHERSVDDLVQAFTREELVREFKRVVLPRVHPDTSNTSPEVFKTVFEVYKKGDLLLMEAYIVEYKGDFNLPPEGDVLENLEQALKRREYTLQLLGRMQNRVERLHMESPLNDLENLDKIQADMGAQRQEILARLQVEGEKILYWREKIEGLGKDYMNRPRKE